MISSAFNSPISLLGRLKFSMKRLTHAGILINFVQLEKRFESRRHSWSSSRTEITVQSPLLRHACQLAWAVFLISVASETLSVLIWLTGQSDSSFRIKSGQLNHFFSFAKFDTLMSLVVKSAGFWLVGAKRHCLGFVRLCISPTRFATKGLNIRLLSLIHHRAVISTIVSCSALQYSVTSSLEKLKIYRVCK